MATERDAAQRDVDDNDDEVINESRRIMLEAEMVAAGVRVYAVDPRRDEVYATRETQCDYEDQYWMCANGLEFKGRTVSAAEAYSALRLSLLTDASSVDLEGTSSLAVSSPPLYFWERNSVLLIISQAPDGVALMSQVASLSVVVIEYPRGEFSSEFASLLGDSSITKVSNRTPCFSSISVFEE
jgi:hypothetical protein